MSSVWPFLNEFVFEMFLDVFILSVFCLHVCIYTTRVHLVPGEIRRQCWTPGARVTDGCEPPPYGCWEPNLGPLQEQQMLLTAEPSL